MSDLVAWVRAQLDATEAAAKAAYGCSWLTASADTPGELWVLTEDMHLCEADAASAEHIALHDPAAALADVEAKRAILDELVAMAEAADQDDDNDRAVRTSVRFLVEKLAEGFRGRPGYEEACGELGGSEIRKLRPDTGDGRSLPCTRCGTSTPDASYCDGCGMPFCDNCTHECDAR